MLKLYFQRKEDFVMFLTSTSTSVSPETFPEWLPPLIMLPIMILIIVGIVNASKKKKARKAELQQSGLLQYSAFHHVNGLPIPENLLCEIRSYGDRLDFKAGTTNIKLPREKITDMCIKTDTEIQDQVVSSVGGAIAGGMMFGALGAIIGGRAKNKKMQTITQYLIITYTEEHEELKYIGFNIKNNPPSAVKLVKEFQALNSNSEIQIEL